VGRKEREGREGEQSREGSRGRGRREEKGGEDGSIPRVVTYHSINSPLFSDRLSKIKLKDTPWPLFTAIRRQTDTQAIDSQWYEFDHVKVKNFGEAPDFLTL
jgi:hypothetical protein